MIVFAFILAENFLGRSGCSSARNSSAYRPKFDTHSIFVGLSIDHAKFGQYLLTNGSNLWQLWSPENSASLIGWFPFFCSQVGQRETFQPSWRNHMLSYFSPTIVELITFRSLVTWYSAFQLLIPLSPVTFWFFFLFFFWIE